MGRFTRDQMLMLAELESNRIGEVWTEVHDRLTRQGLPHSPGPRFGYTRVREPSLHYEIDPVAAEHLRAAYQTILDGGTFRSIGRSWDEAGITNPYGRPWSEHGVILTMDSGFAAGLLRRLVSHGHDVSRITPGGRSSGSLRRRRRPLLPDPPGGTERRPVAPDIRALTTRLGTAPRATR